MLRSSRIFVPALAAVGAIPTPPTVNLKVKVRGSRKALMEEGRFEIAKAIVEHLKLCRWEFSKQPLQ
jgi:hypothetical protein